MSKIAIIGAGAAGLLAAIAVLENGAVPVIFEQKPKVGIKLSITGKGRCNLTNECDIEEFIKNIPGNGIFLYSALYTFNSYNLRELLNKLGVVTKVERGGRVFPESDKATDVVSALSSHIVSSGGIIKLNSRVNKIWIENDTVKGIYIDNKKQSFDKVILATGGMSYPKTGSNGVGYKLAEDAGHSIIKPIPSLVPLETKESWVNELQGLALKNVRVSAYWRDRLIAEDFGEMLFTHYGVSGPVILTLSRQIVKALKNNNGPVTIKINLKPALTKEKIDARMQRIFTENSRKLFKNSLDTLLPKALIEPIISLSGIDSKKQVSQITKKERNSFVELLQGVVLQIVDSRGFEEAIITSGGINVDEVNPTTMESKIIEGLFFAGEVLDIDGYTGGFNLQVAFSTGYLAGKSTLTE